MENNLILCWYIRLHSVSNEDDKGSPFQKDCRLTLGVGPLLPLEQVNQCLVEHPHERNREDSLR